MGIRDSMNKNQGVAIGGACALILIALVVIVLQARDGNAASAGMSNKSFYTVDDGATWFADDAQKVPPFPHEGKQAVRAYVYRGPDGKEFVGFLECYTPAGKQAIELALKRPPEQQLDDPYQAGGPDAMQVKRPGAKAWVSVTNPRAQHVYAVQPPKGQSGTVTQVMPE